MSVRTRVLTCRLIEKKEQVLNKKDDWDEKTAEESERRAKNEDH